MTGKVSGGEWRARGREEGKLDVDGGVINLATVRNLTTLGQGREGQGREGRVIIMLQGGKEGEERAEKGQEREEMG